MALEALNSPTGTPTPPPFQFESNGQQLRYIENWRKGKRSKRSRSMEHQPTEEEYLALCLIMLARSGGSVNHQRSLPPPAPVMKLHAPSSSSVAEEEKEKMVYKCSVCGKGFGSYQALGGHKRCHYDGGIGNGNANSGVSASVGVTSSEGVGSTVSHRDFDLNIPALPEFWLGFGSGEDEVESPHPAKKSRLCLPPKYELFQH
ncbi:zinc finger protein ZAT10-like [Capsicum galapagoense]